MSSLAVAQHEAAHVVVGLALGLRLWKASAVELGDAAGWAQFYEGPREAMLIMTAAGVAWERRCGDLSIARFDLADLRRMRVKGNARIRVLERAAWAVLASRPGAHARVTRALIEGDVTAAHIARMVERG